MLNCRKRLGEVSEHNFTEKDALIFNVILVFDEINRIVFLLAGNCNNSQTFYVNFKNLED